MLVTVPTVLAADHQTPRPVRVGPLMELSIGGSSKLFDLEFFENISNQYSRSYYIEYNSEYVDDEQYLMFTAGTTTTNFPREAYTCPEPEEADSSTCKSFRDVVTFSIQLSCGFEEGECGTLTEGQDIDIAADQAQANKQNH